MKYYRLRPGIVLTTICGQDILIATPEARPFCKKIQEINPTGGDIVRFMEGDARTFDELMDLLTEEYEIEDPTEIKEDIMGFLQNLIKDGYVLEDEAAAE